MGSSFICLDNLFVGLVPPFEFYGLIDVYERQSVIIFFKLLLNLSFSIDLFPSITNNYNIDDQTLSSNSMFK
jgi:hypothetical protein